jgi:hypothetical protein
VGNWRMLFLPLTEDAASVLGNLATKFPEVARGAACFDPKAFVVASLDRLEQQGIT